MLKLSTTLYNFSFHIFSYFSSGIVLFLYEKNQLTVYLKAVRINSVFVFFSRFEKLCEPFSKLEFFQVNGAYFEFFALVYKNMQRPDSSLVYIEIINANSPNFGRGKLVFVVYCVQWCILFHLVLVKVPRGKIISFHFFRL